MSQATREIFHVAGDYPDPEGTGKRGLAATYDFTRAALGHPMIAYRDMVLEADVYQLPGAPMHVHVICPLCLAAGNLNMLTIKSDRKAIYYEPKEAVPPFPGWTRVDMETNFPGGAGGLLSVEPFACTWELQPSLQRDFGLARCPWKVAIDRNVARDV